jgi:curved DNA-binding protein CbpA
MLLINRLIHSCPYRILGIPKNSSKQAVKKAYLELVFHTHPDRNPKNKDEFLEISKAYEQITKSSAHTVNDKEEKSYSKHTSRYQSSNWQSNSYRNMSTDDDPEKYNYWEYDTANWKGHPAHKGPRYMSNGKFAVLITIIGLSLSYFVFRIGLKPRIANSDEMFNGNSKYSLLIEDKAYYQERLKRLQQRAGQVGAQVKSSDDNDEFTPDFDDKYSKDFLTER